MQPAEDPVCRQRLLHHVSHRRFLTTSPLVVHRLQQHVCKKNKLLRLLMQSSHSVSTSLSNSCFPRNPPVAPTSTEVPLSRRSLIGRPDELASGQITHWLPRCCCQHTASDCWTLNKLEPRPSDGSVRRSG